MKRTFIAFILFVVSIGTYGQSPEWISFFNNSESGNESITDVAFDNLGNTYLTGYGVMISGQQEDILTVKSNASGVVEWSKIFNGPQNGDDVSEAMFVDDMGNVYVTGYSRYIPNTYKIVTLKYSSSGDLLWISAFDSLGQSSSFPLDIWVDNSGYIFVTGYIYLVGITGSEIVTIKMDSNGNIVDYAYFSQVPNVNDIGTKIITDNSGNIYVGGGSFRNIALGTEAIIIKYNSSLDTSWVIRVNGNSNSSGESVVDLELDDNGNIYALCYLQNSPGLMDFAVLKIDSNGGIVWRVEYDEAGALDVPEAMTMDENGNIYVTGRVRRASGNSYNDFIIIKYNNDGIQQWKSYYNGPNNLDDDPIDIVLDHNGNIFVCGESNRDGFAFKFIVVKYSPTGVFEWEYVYDEDVNGKAMGLRVDNQGYVYAAGEAENSLGNLDLFAVKLSKTTSIGDEINPPDQFMLYQNHPNPFNPGTMISWQSPVGSWQVLKVFDVLGREVATLVNEYKPAGNHTVEFNAAGLASGIYFYSINAGTFNQVRKMTLIK